MEFNIILPDETCYNFDKETGNERCEKLKLLNVFYGTAEEEPLSQMKTPQK